MTEPSALIPIETFRRLVAADPASEKAIMDAEVRPALKARLEGLRASGRLSPIPGADGHATPLTEAWDAFLGDAPASPGETEWRWRGILEAIEPAGILFFVAAAAVQVEGGKDPGAVIPFWYERMATGLADGRIGWLQSYGQSCQTDGVTYRTAWDGWSPTLGTRGDDGAFVRMQPLSRPAHVEVEVDFPTGEILVSDWFRIPAFTDVVDGGVRPEVGTAMGREAMTERYAREFGFACVHTGGTGYALYEVDGCLVAGSPDPNDEPDAEPLGRLRGGFRAVTLIDREVLTGIVARTVGAAAAAAMVEAYLAEAGDEVIRVEAEPGTRHLYFAGETESFSEGFRPAGIDLEGFEPGLVLSGEPLDLEPGPTAGP